MALTHTEYASQILAKLKDIQADRGLNDSDFARLLHVKRPTWVLASQGRQRLGLTITQAAAKTFAHDAQLQELVAAFFLTYKVRTSADKVRTAQVVRTPTDSVPTRELAEVTR